jgi:hypothetical protein
VPVLVDVAAGQEQHEELVQVLVCGARRDCVEGGLPGDVGGGLRSVVQERGFEIVLGVVIEGHCERGHLPGT